MVLLRGLNYDFSGQQSSYLVSDLLAGSNTISIMNNTGLAIADYVLIEPYTERSEIAKISSLTLNTGITFTTGLKFNHKIGIMIYKMPYNQIRFYSCATVSGTYVAIVSGLLDADYKDVFTPFNYATGTTALFYKRTFYNATTLLESDIAISDYWQTSDEELYITPQELRVYIQFDKNDYPNEDDMRTLIRLAQDQFSLDCNTTNVAIRRIGMYMLSKWYVMRGLATRSISKGYITINAEGRQITKAFQELVLEGENTLEEYKKFLTSNLRLEVGKTNFMLNSSIITPETRQNYIDVMTGTQDAMNYESGYKYSYGLRRRSR